MWCFERYVTSRGCLLLGGSRLYLQHSQQEGHWHWKERLLSSKIMFSHWKIWRQLSPLLSILEAENNLDLWNVGTSSRYFDLIATELCNQLATTQFSSRSEIIVRVTPFKNITIFANITPTNERLVKVGELYRIQMYMQSWKILINPYLGVPWITCPH